MLSALISVCEQQSGCAFIYVVDNKNADSFDTGGQIGPGWVGEKWTWVKATHWVILGSDFDLTFSTKESAVQ